ncbi:alternate-type signal peptide domain-containing protein [Rhodococcus hoagii]|nr:alternate-type signal peptide domain-containing protein [Prescottella equi]
MTEPIPDKFPSGRLTSFAFNKVSGVLQLTPAPRGGSAKRSTQLCMFCHLCQRRTSADQVVVCETKFDWSKCLYADAPPCNDPYPRGQKKREHPHEQEDQGRNRRRCCCSPPRGGAGTFALWSDTETVTGGTINSGTLEFVGTTAAGTWYDGATAISDIANYRIVPGKTLTYRHRRPFTLKATISPQR